MHRITFHFGLDSQGWSETLFRSTPFGPSDSIFLEAYINRRLELLANDTTLQSVRMSNVDTKRDVVIYPLPIGGRRGAWALAKAGGTLEDLTETFSEDTFTALLVRLTDGQNNYRSFAMLGFPDHIFSGNRVVQSEQALLTSRLNNWIAAMTQASLGGKFQSGATVSGRISVYAPKEPANQLVSLGLRGGIPAIGSLVTLGGMGPFKKLNRTWRVAGTAPGDADADGYIYLKGTQDLNVFGDVPSGNYKASTYNVNVLNSYSISRLTSRKTGISFATVRGRR